MKCLEMASPSNHQLVEVKRKGPLVELGPLKMILANGSLLEVLILKRKEVIDREVGMSFDEGSDYALGENVDMT